VKQTLMVLGLVLAASTAFGQTRSVFSEDLTWFEIRDAIAGGKTSAIVFAGGIEQNGPHMTIVKHNAIGRYVAGTMAEQLGNALVYPIVPFSPAGDPVEKTGHARFVGTVSLSSEVFMGVMRQVALSALSGGFKNVFLMGDHGGGQSELKLAAETLDAEWRAKGAHVYYVAFTKSAQQTNAYLAEHKIPGGGHAGVAETSQVMFLDGQKWIRKDKLTAAKGQPEPTTGVNGDPSPATAEMGKMFLDLKVADGVEQIRKSIAEQQKK
jgi:creatinine amidohydrolase